MRLTTAQLSFETTVSAAQPGKAARAEARLTRAVTLSIVIPTLNESARLSKSLRLLAPLRARGAEVIVVDGGSDDMTISIARPYADIVARSAPGRALQLNAGAALASAPALLFLHADTWLPEGADALIRAALAGEATTWGFFRVQFDSPSPVLRVVALMMNIRSQLSKIATGDQALFVHKSAFQAVGSFPAIAIMEDVALSKRLRSLSTPKVLRAKVTTSARRWQQGGVVRTIALMWWLRFAYAVGVSPEKLGRLYRTSR